MSLAVTVDENGITVKSFRDVRNDVAAKFKSIFGEDIDTSPSSPDGQLIDLFVYAYHDAALAIQGGLSSLDVDSAQGTFLDNIGTIMGVERNGDDDETYRARLTSASTTGYATYDNMLTYLREKISASVNLIANDEPETDSNGVPGHKIAVYIPEGYTAVDENENDVTNDYVAQHIWVCKPAGIGTYGNVSGIAHDRSGTAHTVYFNQVSATSSCYMRITITEYTEEQLPADYIAQVKSAVAQWAVKEYIPGKDIIPKRAITAIYTIPGIDDVKVEVSENGSSGWTEDRIPIDASHYAYIPEENITVTKTAAV